MRPHPATYLAKFYLSRRTHSHKQIQGLLEVNSLGGLTIEEIEAINDEMDYPILYRPHVRSHGPSQRFLRKEGVLDAWRSGPDMRQAKRVLESNPLRQAVETFILSPVKAEQAVRKIQQKLDFYLTARAYDLYRHYFWNRDLLTGLEWGDFIQTRDAADRQLLQLAVGARGASGAQLLLWKMGMGGLRQMEANRGFTTARNVSFMMLEQTSMHEPSKNHSEMWLNYIRAAKMCQDAVDSSGSAVQDVVESFNAFRMRHEETKAPSIKELTGGNFSPAENAEDGEDGMDY